MAAYIVVDIEIHDPQQYDVYKLMAPPSIAEFGGRYLARGGASQALEGDWQPRRLVILEFPSSERARLVGIRFLPRSEAAAAAHRAHAHGHDRRRVRPGTA